MRQIRKLTSLIASTSSTFLTLFPSYAHYFHYPFFRPEKSREDKNHVILGSWGAIKPRFGQFPLCPAKEVYNHCEVQLISRVTYLLPNGAKNSARKAKLPLPPHHNAQTPTVKITYRSRLAAKPSFSPDRAAAFLHQSASKSRERDSFREVSQRCSFVLVGVCCTDCTRNPRTRTESWPCYNPPVPDLDENRGFGYTRYGSLLKILLASIFLNFYVA